MRNKLFTKEFKKWFDSSSDVEKAGMVKMLISRMTINELDKEYLVKYFRSLKLNDYANK